MRRRRKSLRPTAAAAWRTRLRRKCSASGRARQRGSCARRTAAGRAYRRALVVFEDCYGPDHFEVAQACANLAVLHADQGQFRTAEALGRRSLRIFETVLGPGDAEVGLTVLNLACAVAGQGRRAEAAVLAERAEQVLAARLPVGHPHLHAARQARRQFRRRS